MEEGKVDEAAVTTSRDKMMLNVVINMIRKLVDDVAQMISEERKPEMSFELQQGYRILRELMCDANKSTNGSFIYLPKLSEDQMNLYTSKVKKPMYLMKMREKFEERVYETITQFVSDFRLMIENCLRFNGPDHHLSKKAQRLNTILEQKLALLNWELREKTTIEATSTVDTRGPPKSLFEQFSGLRRRAKAIIPNDNARLLKQLREEEAENRKLQRLQGIEEKRKATEAFEKTVIEWENNLLKDPIRTWLMTSWEIPQINHFFYLTQEALNLPLINHYELERSFLIPRESALFAMIMTTLLSTPSKRPRLDKKPPMPYRIWSKRLKAKVSRWYKVLKDRGYDKLKASQKFGFDPRIFDVLGFTNPLEQCEFHELSYMQRVWIVKCLCDYCLEHHVSVYDAIAAWDLPDQRELVLGNDERGNTFIHFPQFCGDCLRVYKQSYIPESAGEPEARRHWLADLCGEAVPEEPEEAVDVVSPSPSKCRKSNPVIDSPTLSRVRPSRLRQFVSPVDVFDAEKEERVKQSVKESDVDDAISITSEKSFLSSPSSDLASQKSNSAKKRKRSKIFGRRRKYTRHKPYIPHVKGTDASPGMTNNSDAEDDENTRSTNSTVRMLDSCENSMQQNETLENRCKRKLHFPAEGTTPSSRFPDAKHDKQEALEICRDEVDSCIRDVLNDLISCVENVTRGKEQCDVCCIHSSWCALFKSHCCSLTSNSKQDFADRGLQSCDKILKCPTINNGLVSDLLIPAVLKRTPSTEHMTDRNLVDGNTKVSEKLIPNFIPSTWRHYVDKRGACTCGSFSENLPRWTQLEFPTSVEDADFVMVAEDVEQLRSLAKKFESPPVPLKKTRKRLQKQKPCIAELYERLHNMLIELSPFEHKLLQAARRARHKLKKDYDLWQTKGDAKTGVWSSESENSSSCETDDENSVDMKDGDNEEQLLNSKQNLASPDTNAALKEFVETSTDADQTVKNLNCPENIELNADVTGRLRKSRSQQSHRGNRASEMHENLKGRGRHKKRKISPESVHSPKRQEVAAPLVSSAKSQQSNRPTLTTTSNPRHGAKAAASSAKTSLSKSLPVLARVVNMPKQTVSNSQGVVMVKLCAGSKVIGSVPLTALQGAGAKEKTTSFQSGGAKQKTTSFSLPQSAQVPANSVTARMVNANVKDNLFTNVEDKQKAVSPDTENDHKDETGKGPAMNTANVIYGTIDGEKFLLVPGPATSVHRTGSPVLNKNYGVTNSNRVFDSASHKLEKSHGACSELNKAGAVTAEVSPLPHTQTSDVKPSTKNSEGAEAAQRSIPFIILNGTSSPVGGSKEAARLLKPSQTSLLSGGDHPRPLLLRFLPQTVTRMPSPVTSTASGKFQTMPVTVSGLRNSAPRLLLPLQVVRKSTHPAHQIQKINLNTTSSQLFCSTDLIGQPQPLIPVLPQATSVDGHRKMTTANPSSVIEENLLNVVNNCNHESKTAISQNLTQTTHALGRNETIDTQDVRKTISCLSAPGQITCNKPASDVNTTVSSNCGTSVNINAFTSPVKAVRFVNFDVQKLPYLSTVASTEKLAQTAVGVKQQMMVTNKPGFVVSSLYSNNEAEAKHTNEFMSVSAINALPSSRSLQVNAIPSAVTQQVNAIPSAVTQQVNAIPSAVTQQVNAIPSAVTQQVNAIPSAVTQQANAIPSAVTQQVNAIPSAVTQQVNAIPSAVTQQVNAIPSAVTQQVVVQQPVTHSGTNHCNKPANNFDAHVQNAQLMLISPATSPVRVSKPNLLRMDVPLNVKTRVPIILRQKQ